MSADNNSTRKLKVGLYRKPDGARWVYVDLLKWARGGEPAPRMIPSFLDLHRIIQAIAYCEDESYPPPAKGRGRLAEFLQDAVYQGDFQTLARKYKIPERDGDRVVKTNGANVPFGAVTPTIEAVESEPVIAQRVEVELTDKDIPW